MNRWPPVALLLAFSATAACAWPWTHRLRGQAVFADAGCLHCHTIHSAGGHKGPNLSSVGARMNSEQLREQILMGGNGMPPFADVLAPADVNDLIAYLRTCRTPATRQHTSE